MRLCADPADKSPRILSPCYGRHSRPFPRGLLLLPGGRKSLRVFLNRRLRHHKHCGHDIEGFRQLIQCSERQILFRPFDRPHIGAVKVALDGKLLLRPAPSHSEPSHDHCDDVNRRGLSHAQKSPVRPALALQGIPSICEGQNIFLSLNIEQDVKSPCWFRQRINRNGLNLQNQVAASPMRGRFRPANGS
jgi:hypothetical protein